MLREPRPSGSAAGNLPELESMLAHYYRLRGWDEQGRPTVDSGSGERESG
jgi:aldehyde:ferredoxin oxidoreductase